MLTDPRLGEVEGILERLRGPDAGLVADLAARADLHRAVVVDVESARAVVRPYAWLLDRIGEQGIRLTPAGYLPPAVVTETVTALGWESCCAGPRPREHLAIPVLELRQSARRLGLVRTYRGVLLRTVLGGRLRLDPGGLMWHLAGRLPEATDDAGRDAGLLLLLAVASGTPLDPSIANGLLRRGMAALGWREVGSGRPLEEWEAFGAAHATWACLRRLGAIPELRYGEAPTPPPPAGVAIARAALSGPVV